jgi:aerotolerance regulator-like protein/CARDB protein
MFESALNPAFWWGATAIAAPIIIHLINRLRYRRVRWAAMEFLLKSQQRNRRKLIIEQLILLALRCLIVLMIVTLVVRPTWLLGDSGRHADWPTYHVVLLDDSLSMQDVEDPKNQDSPNAFKSGTQLIGELAKRYAEAPSSHFWTVIKFSDPQSPELGTSYSQLGEQQPGTLLTADEATKLQEKLNALQGTYLPIHPLRAVQEGQKFLEGVKEGHRVLHLVSDFRRRDWTQAEADEATQILAELARNGSQVRLHDVARPKRSANAGETPAAHGNLGLMDLVAKSRKAGDSADEPVAVTDDFPVRVVTPGIPVYLHATVKNFGDAARKDIKLTLRVDGTEKLSRNIDTIAGGEEKVVVFDISFTAEERLGHKRISVWLDDLDKLDHLPPDNVRYTFLELQKEIPILLVDPDHVQAEPPPDSYFLHNAFTGGQRSGLRTERIRPSEVKNRKDLDRFSVIFVVNLPGVGTSVNELDPDGLKALESYVERGGSLVFFLGPRTNVASFNDQLYKGGQGIFPVPLTARPDTERSTGQPFVDDAPDPEDHSAKMRIMRAGHPVFRLKGVLADIFTKYSAINRYFKVEPTWKPDASRSVVVQLTNRRPLTFYRKDAADLIAELGRDRGRFGQRIDEYAGKMRTAIEDAEKKRSQKGPLIEPIGGLLSDPALAEHWADARQQPLKQKLEKFHETLVVGDPLVIESSVGKGRTQGHVMAFLTPAAPTPAGRGKDYKWNNWADEMADFFVPMMLDLHGYMTALARSSKELEVNRLLAPAVEVRLNRETNQPTMELWYHREGAPQPSRVDVITATAEGNDLVARIRPIRGPGHYLLKLNQTTTGTVEPTKEPLDSGKPEDLHKMLETGKEAEDRPLAFNVDNRIEGQLARVSEAELQERLALGLQKGNLKVSLTESQSFVQSRPWFIADPLAAASEELVKNKSWSDYSWVLLAFLGFLLLEGFLAMRFSHHQQPGEVPVTVRAAKAH